MSKLTDRAIPSVFLGYEPGTKGYRIYDPVKKQLMVSCDLVFDEERPWNWGGKAGSTDEVAALAVVPDTFTVQGYDDDATAHGPTIGPGVDNEPVLPAVSIPVVGLMLQGHHTPRSQVMED